MNKDNVVYASFPNNKRTSANVNEVTEPINSRGSKLIVGVWVCTVMLWPVLRWIIAIDCVVRFSVMIFHLSSFNIFIFILHFAALTALTYYVSVYKPIGLSLKNKVKNN